MNLAVQASQRPLVAFPLALPRDTGVSGVPREIVGWLSPLARAVGACHTSTAGAGLGTRETQSRAQSLSLRDTVVRCLQHWECRRRRAPLRRLPHSSASLYQQTAPAAASPASDRRGPLALYEADMKDGRLHHDERQEAAMRLLQDLYGKLEALYPKRSRPSNLTLVDNVSTSRSRKSWWTAIIDATNPHLGHEHEGDNASRPCGIYMWGGVGVGKTMLMDIFVKATPRHFYVLRTHFHDFMLSVHKRLRAYSGEQDPLRKVADVIASEARVLCLDELFVTNVADAVILERLFGRLWDRGMTLVATSNRRPDTLYEGGLQRQLFTPFITRLERECIVHAMDSVTDYRRRAVGTVGVYFVRLVGGCTNDDRLDAAFRQVTEGQEPQARDIPVAMGRHLRVPRAVQAACSFTYEELCGANVAAADYIALTSHFHIIALKGVPMVTAANRSSAYRFVTFVDVAYEHRCKLLVSAEGYAEQLFRDVVTQREAAEAGARLSGDAVVDDNLGFAKDRAISRLTEMRSLDYAITHAERYAPDRLLALKEAKAKLEGCA